MPKSSVPKGLLSFCLCLSKHLKKTDPLQQNGRLEKEKPNALEGIDLSNYAGVVVIDDNPAVTDHSFGDGDDGDFQEVTSKKRHRLLADGDTKKLRKEVGGHVVAPWELGPSVHG